MCKYHAVFALIALLVSQQSFADDAVTQSNPTPAAVTSSNSDDDSSLKECQTIANACLSAGFSNGGDSGKAFWHDCMKPILLGQTVAGVSIDAKEAIACRKFKIEKMKKELKQLQQIH